MAELHLLSQPRWFAVYVRSRHEARTAKHFEDRRIEFFLPQYRSERKWSDRSVELLLPLFPSYIFVRIECGQSSRVLETPGVVYLVGARGPEALEDVEIERMKNICANESALKPLPEGLASANIGDEVRVTRGPLQGYRGFLSRAKKGRVVLVQDMIRQAMSVEVEMDAIEIIPRPQAPDTAVAAGAGTRNGQHLAGARLGGTASRFQKPHTNAQGEAQETNAGFELGQGADAAPSREYAPQGDPLCGDAAGGFAPRG
jgi:transcription antitermination factor NusG